MVDCARVVSVEQIEAAIGHIKHRLRATGEREVKALAVGEMVMRELKQLDEVAYIRFASVYRRFQDLNQFREEIEEKECESPAARHAKKSHQGRSRTEKEQVTNQACDGGQLE